MRKRKSKKESEKQRQKESKVSYEGHENLKDMRRFGEKNVSCSVHKKVFVLSINQQRHVEYISKFIYKYKTVNYRA